MAKKKRKGRTFPEKCRTQLSNAMSGGKKSKAQKKAAMDSFWDCVKKKDRD